ncbi:hypothetical protein D9615_004544 [Tricholomella constricta]|uniref:Protein kinase domain-containing protein n=1 Tax=Tricholomella constricta TaxID=117010 RepID=A0A8H5HC50_9AGAR|nr:hypothetical protein D9615_004544 [Tricholomella constricta]
MIASTPTKDYLSLRTRNPSMSPSCRPRHCTPPRLVSASNDPPSYDSPMLTPSPLRQRPLFPNAFNPQLADPDDLFLQSPYKSPAQAHHLHSLYSSKPQPITADDDEGSIFLSSPSTSFSPFFPTSSSQPLRTPVKQIHRFPSRPALSVKQLNTGAMPSDSLTPATRVGVGTKRKSTPHSTPIRQHNLTPLMISSQRNIPGSVADVAMLDRLAPLPAPKFTPATPQTNAETDAHLRRQTATLTRLKLSDFIETREDIEGANNDSGCEMDDDDQSDALFTGSVRLQGKVSYTVKGKEKEEVAEAISPGGHIIKRRARRRPLSAELLESNRPSLSPIKAPAANASTHRSRNAGIVFPSAPQSRKRTSSGSSSSELGSPVPRRRVSNARPCPPKFTSVSQTTSRLPLNRQDSVSSATLFFGPAIPQAGNSAPAARSRINTSLSSSTSSAPLAGTKRPKAANRHSYAGSGASQSNLQAWNTIQTREPSPSPKSSPPARAIRSNSQDDYDQDMFFGSGTQDSSFMFSVTEGTPSPRTTKTNPTTLPRKYKPRDSGVVLSDDEDDNMSIGGDYLHVMPPASTSVGSIHSDTDDNLVTPGCGPEASSGWPSVFVTGTDDAGSGEGLDVDAFIMRTLAAASKGTHDMKKKVPGTPVKKVKTTYLPGGARPWQSAIASKVGLRYDVEPKKGKVPRQSLPAAFPPVGKKGGKLTLDTDSEDDEDSPGRRRDKYVGLGLGRPSASTPQDGNPLMSRTRWLMRRSSSGAFSSGSESMSSSGTPTRVKSKDWSLLQTTPRIPSQLSPSKNTFKFSPVRTASGSSSSSGATLNSPSVPLSRRFPTSSIDSQRPIPNTRRLSEPFAEEQPGRFERDFLEDDEVGSGEFGKVIKVRCKNGDDGEVYAVKKSKRFEGPRHRLRLREEVHVLQHLSEVAASSSFYEGNRHPNVLAYIDSWEENEALYIRTELCESGNLSQFLWEFGRVYPRLAEDRVWKIVVDLSNGLRFIHDAGVIHLDLKPSNVFVTAEGRFKIGDFGMATVWPRSNQLETTSDGGGFEREGDKLYLAPEVLQGRYSKAADVFSFGMTILETATNIVVPDQGEAWHRLRREDFSQVDLDESPELLDMIRQMMRTEPSLRMSIHAVCDHPVVSRARAIMERVYIAAKRDGTSVFAASPLGSVHKGFLEEILGRRVENGAMDVSA